ncbi:MAG: AAA family ATPase [Jatrophihabitans sp.]|uniref:helix-turn-helix transcriptional regulator n=1 Tax=Jatrophihabitans sp. TaxID=1932789 RepID=UPI003910335B
MPRSTAPLVGRAAEMATLINAMSEARAGTSAAVIIGGDAGVGKTRLLAEWLGAATADGVLCLIGHCVDLGDTPPPYLPFTEAFTRLSAEDPELGEKLVSSFPALARLLPGRAAEHQFPVERGELFDSVLAGLAFLAAERPVALVVEDAHWADQATRDLLGFLFTRMDGERVALVVTYRSDDLHRRHPLRRTLAEWSRLLAVTRMQLDPLEADDVRALVRSVHAGRMADKEIDSIVTRADGNAFFAEELINAAEQCADARQLPWHLADLLLVRLDRLSDDARQLVRVTAVGGRRVTHDMLEAVADLPGSRLDDALRDAIDAHVLQLTSSGRGYVFRHALLAEAIYDDLLPGERVRLHATYAAVLSARPDRRAAELARHARASHDLPTAYSASVAAGHEAMALAAPQEALQHYETALELAPQVPNAPEDRSDLILAAVEAADAAGHTQRGLKLARRALAELPPDAAPERRATLLLAVVIAALGNEIDDEAMAFTSEALHLVPAEPPTAFRARLLAVHARVALIMGQEVDAERTAREALAVSEAIDCRNSATDARTTLAQLARRTVDPGEAARLIATVVEQARDSGDAASELRSRYSLASLWLEQCELDKAQDEFQLNRKRAVELGRTWDAFGLHSRAMSATMQYVRGDWDGALRTLDTRGQQPTMMADAVFRSTALTVQAGRGEVDALPVVDELRPYWRREGRVGLYSVFGALEIYEQQAQPAPALALIDDLVEALGTLWLDPWFLARIQLSAMGIAVLGAAAARAPESQHELLAADGARLLADGCKSADKGLPRGRALGREGQAWLARLEAEGARLRWLTGQNPPAAEELVEAWRKTVDAFDYGQVVAQARSRVRLAEALRATGRADEAAEQADLARTAAKTMGATPMLMELRALGTTGRRPADDERSGLIALTDRERDVLSHLVEGRTNRQIAGTLYISEKTVSVHVSNILAKLGVRSRAEAAALARRS